MRSAWRWLSAADGLPGLLHPDCHYCTPAATPQVCFVGDEGFRQLSRPDDNAWQQLSRAMSLDASRKRKPEGSPAASPTAAAAAAKIAAPAAAPAAAPTAAAAGSGSPQAAAAAGGSPKAVPAAKAPPPSTAAAAAK